MTRLSLRIEFGPHCMLGHGKVRLLELIEQHGSIAAAGRAMGMSYRRAWQLVDSLNRAFTLPLVETQLGGFGGGGASVTAFGRETIARFRAMEREAEQAITAHIAVIAQSVAPVPEGPLPPADDED